MNIGQAAAASGVTAKMIRHYEEIGLLPKVGRSEGGYRQYEEREIHNLKFIRRARSLGFAIKDIKTLLGLWRNKKRSSREVKDLARTQIESLEAKISEMQSMLRSLQHLVKCCRGDDRPDCPILDQLSTSDSSRIKY